MTKIVQFVEIRIQREDIAMCYCDTLKALAKELYAAKPCAYEKILTSFINASKFDDRTLKMFLQILARVCHQLS